MTCSLPSRIASKAMNRVISFDMDAGGKGSSAFLAKRTVPVVWLIVLVTIYMKFFYEEEAT